MHTDKLAPNRRGGDHSLSFQYELTIDEVNIKFESDWCKKKDEAKRQLIQKIVHHFMHNEYMSSDAAPSSASSSMFQPEDMEQIVVGLITKWQKENLPVIKKALMLKDEEQHSQLNSFLTVAFIHPSFVYTDQIKFALQKFLKTTHVHYERFEFLGDAVLGLVVARDLFDKHENDSPGALSNKRRTKIQFEACADHLRRLGLDKFVIHRDVFLSLSGKVLADVFEAVLGALYVIYEEESFEYVRQYTGEESDVYSRQT